jgi:hypothetical protein
MKMALKRLEVREQRHELGARETLPKLLETLVLGNRRNEIMGHMPLRNRAR